MFCQYMSSHKRLQETERIEADNKQRSELISDSRTVLTDCVCSF